MTRLPEPRVEQCEGAGDDGQAFGQGEQANDCKALVAKGQAT